MPLANPPLLDTPHLRLRLMRADDVDALLRIFSDPLVMAAFDAPPFDRAQMLQWLQRNLDHQAKHGYGLFSVVLKANGSQANGLRGDTLLIGDCGLELLEVEGANVAELGYDFRISTTYSSPSESLTL